MASVPLNELGLDEFVLGLTVQRGLSGDRSYSFPPMMIFSNFSAWPAMVVSIVNREACCGLTTMIPSPVASNEMLPLTMWATRLKCASLTSAVRGLVRISCAVGGLAGATALLLQAATTSAAICSTSQAQASPLRLLDSEELVVIQAWCAGREPLGRDDLLDGKDGFD